MANNNKGYRRRGRPPKNKIEYTARKLGVPVWIVVIVLVVAIAIYSFLAYSNWWYPFDGTIFSGNPDSVYAPKDDDSDEPQNPPTTPPVENPGVVNSGELSIHFLELGNEYTGDCTYIKVGNDIDVLVDAGSRVNSIPTISTYLNQYVTDGVLEYVFVTHAHQDHYAGFATGSSTDSLFDIYECETIITFSGTYNDAPITYEDTDVYSKITMHNTDTTTSTSTLMARFVRELQETIDTPLTKGDKAGQYPKHYTALECYNNLNGASRNIALDEDISIEILYNYYYDHKTTDENDYSVCFMLKHGERNYLFTGDLEKEGEEHLAEFYDLPQVELFKGGHHGSPTSSQECLLQEIKPKMVCVCCCAGAVEYTQNPDNTFPSQEFIDRISKYTTKVYVTSMGVVTYELDSKHGQSGDKSFYKYDESTGKYIYTDKETGDYIAKDVESVSMNGNIKVVSNVDGIMVTCSNNNILLKDTEWFSANRTMPSYWQTTA